MKNIKILSIFMLFGIVISACNDNPKKKQSVAIEKNETESAAMSQTQTLAKRKANFNKTADENLKKVYQEGVDAIEKEGIVKQAKNVGNQAPNFTLKNAIGKEVSLQDYLQKGPVVLIWYRGNWCPYCNINLQYLQQELPNFKLQGANLIALTPELPDSSIKITEKHHLEFEVLSDIGNKVAKEYGIVFKLTGEIGRIYKEELNLSKYNGDSSNELPLAATYIIDTDGKIVYAFLDPDYRKRAEPTEITAFLKSMTKQ